MSREDPHKKYPEKPFIENNQEDESGDSGGEQGGQSGAIEFRIQDLVGPARDDLLSPSEIKRLLVVHKDLHKSRVDKQKALRDERAAIKEGRYVSTMETKYGKGYGMGGGVSKYKTHPISHKAQFSGIDKQVIGIPTLNEADTNPEAKDALENRYENKHRNTPKFNPRPRYPG
jgi:hypothetical protein